MLRFVYTASLVICFMIPLKGQDTIFFEDFDSSPGAKPAGWTTELESGESIWQFVNGGGTKSPEIPGSRKPPTAYSDTVNALYFFESLGSESVILVTPPIDLEFALQPELRFMHVQREGNLGFGAAHDELRIYYKTHIDSAWTEVRKIGEYVDEVYDWTEQTILLPEGAKVPECYLAFKATTKYGWGVGIDDISVIETDYQPRYVDAVTIFQEETGIIPSGSDNNPMMRINVTVKGNTDSLALNSLDVSSLNTSDTDIESNGVKLYYNYNNKNFYAATQLASASFVSGEAQFSSLDFNLPTGHTSLWIAFDLKTDAVHNNLADVMLQAGSLNIEGSTYPAGDASPAGSRLIREAVIFDDFASDMGWVLAGDFERDRPGGLGGQFLGSPDPSFASGDTMILGNDLTGLGAIPGDYEPNVGRYDNLATSPSFNLFYYNDIQVNFLRWLNVANNDTASIEMSLDGGSNWSEVWSNDNNVFTDGAWQSFSQGMPGAQRQSQVQVRFNLGPTTPTDNFSGWNIENFAITGNYIEYDVGIDALLSPGTGCGHSADETVGIRVANLGPGATPAKIPVRYSFDGGSNFTYDTINGSIAFGGTRDFYFAQTIDLSTPGVYDVVIESTLGVDEAPENNLLDTILYVDPDYTLPYTQDFETGNDFWRADGSNATFEYGTPMGAVIHTAASGVNAWVTNLDGDYSDNEDSYLVGPCFDFTGIDYPVFEFSLFSSTEADTDGANLEYSLDNGQSWYRVGNLGEGDEYYFNWYNSDAITSLAGGHGWTGGPSLWHTARILLDTLVFRDMPSVKFRFHFSSDASGRLEGIGIDDIRIYEVPRDVGVVSIEYPESGCGQDIGDHVAVTVRNFGPDTLMAGDTIFVGYDLESDPTEIDTFILAADLLSGGTVPFTFAKQLEVGSSGMKYIEAFTLLDDDIDFYNDTLTNDTISKIFEVAETPYFILPPEIYTVRPDTIVLNAYTGNPSDSYLWQDASTDSAFQVTAYADGIYYATAYNPYCNYSDTTFVYRLIRDVGVTEIVDPVSSCALGASVTPTIRVTNFGTDTLKAGEGIPVRYQVDSDPVMEEIAVLSAEVLPDSSFEYTFAAASDMSAVRSYAFSVYTELAYDDTLANDMLNVIIDVYGYTPIDLGPDVVVRALDYTIDAGAGYDSYLWQDSSTSQTLLVDTTGWYRVTVKQGTMCENSDSLLVTLLVADIGIESLYNPTRHECELTSAEHLEFYVLNAGTDTLHINDTIFVDYQFDGGPWIYDTLVVDRLVDPGDSILYASDVTFDLSSLGSYQFSVIVAYSEDLVPGNETLDQPVDVHGYPTISLGQDTLVHAKTYLLDPGGGFASYLWQDGSSGPQYLVEYENQTPDSLYNVIATDIYGCDATDEVKVSFELTDIGVSFLASPVSACMLTDQEEVRIFVKNFGTDPVVYEDFSVVVSVDDGIPITTEIRSSQLLDPGDSLEFVFGFTFDFSAVGDHRVKAYSIFGQDSDPDNDTLDLIVSHFGYPEPDLGGVNDTLNTQLPYTLDAGAGYASYLWNDVEGDQTLEAVVYGWYMLEVTDPHGCSGNDSIYLMPVTGIGDNHLPGELKIYPVPASERLHLEYRSHQAEDLLLEFYDPLGRKILMKEFPVSAELNETLDVSGFSGGVYFLKLRSGEKQLIRHIPIY